MRQMANRPGARFAAEVRLRRGIPLVAHAPGVPVSESWFRSQRRREAVQGWLWPEGGQRLRARFHHSAQGRAVLSVLPDDADARAVSAHAGFVGMEPRFRRARWS